MCFKNGKWKIFFILLFLLTMLLPLSWLLISKLLLVTVFLLLLHQSSLLLFGYLSLVSLYEVGTGESMHSARQRRNGGEDKQCVISAYVLLEIRKYISVVAPREMVSSHSVVVRTGLKFFHVSRVAP